MSNAPPAHTPATLKFKLSLMMFLEFVIWGAWFEIGFSYIPGLAFGDTGFVPKGWVLPLIFGAFNIGALVALFFMHLKGASERLLKLVVISTLFFLFILMALSMADYATRWYT